MRNGRLIPLTVSVQCFQPGYALVSVALAPLGFGQRGPIGLRERIIVLESLTSIFSALVGTIATRNVLIFHCRVP